NAADKDLVSAYWVRATESAVGEERAFRIQDGYDRVVCWLRDACAAATAEVRLNTVVSAVRWQRGAVRLEARRGDTAEQVEARRLIVTLPLGVLQAPAGAPGAVQFSPDITDQRAIWERLKTGA